MFTHTNQIVAANKAAGRHWFEKGALLFFNSTVYPKVYSGTFFITSERFDEYGPRLFTVRASDSHGAIRTVSGFQAFTSLKEAEDFITTLL